MLDTLKALSDPTRLRLVAILARGEFTVQELTAILGMGQSRISRHLKILTEASILSVQRQGTWGYYSLKGNNPLFREIWPSLENRLDRLDGHKEDLASVVKVLDERRSKSRRFFQQHASQWDRLATQVFPLANYLPSLLEEVPVCGSLLEVGVGTGRLLEGLVERVPRVLGVDHSPAMLEQAQRKVEEASLCGVELRLGEMAHLPVPDSSVECVLLNMVLHHSADPGEVFRELFRVMENGGFLLLADLLPHDREWAREKLADQWLGFGYDRLKDWVTEAGFNLREYRTIEGSSDELPVFIAVAQK